MTRLVPTTLTGRLVATAVALVATISVVIGVTAAAAISSYLTGQLDDDLRRTSDRAAGAVQRGQPIPVEPPTAVSLKEDDGDLGFGQSVGTLTAVLGGGSSWGTVIATRDGRAVWATLGEDALSELGGLPVDGRARTVDVPGVGDYRVRVDEVAGAALVTGLPLRDVEATVRRTVTYELLLALAGTAVAGAAAWVVVRRQMRPLHEVAATAHQVAALPLSEGEVGVTARVPERLTDVHTEVGQVGAALNTLLGHVEQALDDRHHSEQQVRRFVADASHELRTPLAVISGYAELSRRTGAADPQRLVQAMEKVQAEAARMGSLVEDLLLLARLDAGRPLERGAVDLTRLVVESVTDSQVVAPQHRWELDIPDAPVVVTGDEQRLHQVVSNLLSNVRRHTPPGTRVTAHLRVVEVRTDGTDGGRAVLIVEDDGPGIDPELRPRVFERFARGDTARTRAAGGTGLGLSLVRAIVEAHAGTIHLESTAAGTRFTVALPVGA